VDFTFGTAFYISLVFSLFGMAYFSYGKKQGNFPVLSAGVGLMFYSYFVSNVTIMVVAGLALMAFPFVAARLR